MKAIILVAGYNTRLLALTNNVPKALLRIGDVPIIEKILFRILPMEQLSEVFIVSNSKFYRQFDEWLQDFTGKHHTTTKITLVDDGTWTNETRRGAVGDLIFVLEKMNIKEDILLVACDNLFEADLNEFYAMSTRKKASVVAAYKFATLEDVRKKFGVVELADDGRVLAFQEKPENPISSIAATAIYVFRKEHLPHIVLLANNKTDKEINLGEIIIHLLDKKETVYCDFISSWFDIGSPEDLKQAEAYFAR